MALHISRSIKLQMFTSKDLLSIMVVSMLFLFRRHVSFDVESDIVLQTDITTESELKGAEFLVYNGGYFVNTASGIINLNVYEAGDSDLVSYFPSSPCVYDGTLYFHFQYEPRANDRIYIGATQSYVCHPSSIMCFVSHFLISSDTCTGTFKIQTENLPSGLQAVIMYDYASRDGSSSVENFLVICSATNTTCSSMLLFIIIKCFLSFQLC